MSHLQFHSIKLFILRLAWLSLFDEHMTTGRINQVAFDDLAFFFHKVKKKHTQEKHIPTSFVERKRLRVAIRFDAFFYKEK